MKDDIRPASKLYRKRIFRINIFCWLFMLPTVILYGLFQGWPILSGIYFSMLDWSGIGPSAFVGLDNFKEMLKDHLFWNAALNSLKYMLLIVPVEICLSLLMAYILNSRIRGTTIYRTLFFLPVITTSAIVGIIMIFIFGSTGPVNTLFVSLGILKSPVNYLGTAQTALVTVAMIGMWKDMGIYMIYWIAGLQSVPSEVYEAATVDGASRARTFFSVVFPLLLPIGGVITILCTINSLKVFDIVQTMTGGGPYFATDVIATFVYRTAFTGSNGMPRIGYASSAAMMFGFAVIVIGILLNKLRSAIEKRRAI